MATETTCQTERLFDSVNEAASRLGISRSLLYAQIKLNRLKSVKVGRRRLIARDAQAEWIASLPAA